MKKQLFIRGDLNDFYDGKFPLRNQKWIDAIKAEYGGISDGQKIWLFEVTERNGKYDPTIFPGVIRITNGEFEIHANESDMMYLSESEQFKGYSMEDIVGTEYFNSMKKHRPEKF